jgi:hypothetical protein
MQALSNVVVFALEGKVTSALIVHVREVGGDHKVGEVPGLCRGVIVTGLEGVLIHDRAEAIGGLLT